MANHSAEFVLQSPDATSKLARRLAPCLMPGDTLLLKGEIGAGKTFFARELLSEILLSPEDIPSPTFTIVQTYDTRLGEVWHTDLYRLSSPSEIVELGLLDAFADAICLVEWPDRLSDLAPKSALTIEFFSGSHDEERRLSMSWQDARWSPVVDKLAND